MARTGLAHDKRFQDHITGKGHPERPERLVALDEAFRACGLIEACTPIEFEPIDLAHVRKMHVDSYIDRLKSACENGLTYIDVPDSGICRESFEIARCAAGAGMKAVDEVMAGTIDNAFCAVRPPGHHAESEKSMGFCLFNNIAIAAKHLLDEYGLTRVLILDFDVHHGNGTQHMFEADPRVLFVSIHGHPNALYPGTGFPNERGVGAGAGHTINITMTPHSNDNDYRTVFDDAIIPEIERYAPQFILVDAGFDAHRKDPLAPIDLDTESFGWMTDCLTQMAKQHSDGKLVSFLEGGYHLQALAESASLHLARLLDA